MDPVPVPEPAPEPVPKPVDEWSEKLRKSVRKGRGRYYWGLAAMVTVIVGGGAALVWYLFPPPIPFLATVAFDDLCTDNQEVRLRAQVEAPEGDPVPGYLGGLSITFLPNGGAAVKQPTSGTGMAEAKTTLPAGTAASFMARLQGERRRLPSSDSARIYHVVAGTPLVVVDVNHLLAAPRADVWAGELVSILPNPEAAAALKTLADRKHQVVYLALDAELARGYWQRRRWLDGLARFPPGPVLGRPTYHDNETEADARRTVLTDLTGRFRVFAVAQTKESAATFREAKAMPILVGEGGETWKTLPEALEKAVK